MSSSNVNNKQDKIKLSTKWGPDNIVTFLDLYQHYELLWNVRHPDYANKAKRESAILLLKNDLINHGVVVPDIGFLRARIKAIKTTYRSELLKVLETQSTGADIYVPKLPWFNTADRFLNSVVVTRQSQSNWEQEEEWTKFEESFVEEPATNQTNCATQVASNSTKNNFRIQLPKGIKKRQSEQAEEAIKKAKDTENAPKRDEFAVFGELVAHKLRKCSSSLKSVAIAQHSINDILFNLEMEHYTLSDTGTSHAQ